MSYWEKAEQMYLTALNKGLSTMSTENREDALRHMNLLYTHKPVQQDMAKWSQKYEELAEIQNQLFDASEAQIHDKAASCTLTAGRGLIHFVLAQSFNRVLQSAAQTEQDFSNFFDRYIEKIRSGGRTMWVAEDEPQATNFGAICGAAKELGLYHFGILAPNNPIVAFHIRTKKNLIARKPTWAHAFANWYFDPSPEGEAPPDIHGKARCLETGQLLRKEWVLRPDQLHETLEVAGVSLSHSINTTDAMPDFENLGDGYWTEVERRMRKLNS